VVWTRAEELYAECRRMSDRGKPFGLKSKAGNVVASLNFNLNDLSAVVGSTQLKKLPGIVRRRQALASRIIGKNGFKISVFSVQANCLGARPSIRAILTGILLVPTRLRRWMIILT
jgi:hypothetical protein